MTEVGVLSTELFEVVNSYGSRIRTPPGTGDALHMLDATGPDGSFGSMHNFLQQKPIYYIYMIFSFKPLIYNYVNIVQKQVC